MREKIDHIIEIMEHCDGCLPYLLSQVRELRSLLPQESGIEAIDKDGNKRELTKDECVETLAGLISGTIKHTSWQDHKFVIYPSGERLEGREGINKNNHFIDAIGTNQCKATTEGKK